MRQFLWLSILFILCACAVPTWAMDLTPYAKPDAILFSVDASRRLALWHRLLDEAYLKQGDHTQKTDAELATLLNFTAKRMLGTIADDPEMTACAKRLAADGGNPDPLAAFAWFQLNSNEQNPIGNQACDKTMAAFELEDPTRTPVRYAHLIRAFAYAYALGTTRPKSHPENLAKATIISGLLRDQLVASILAHECDASPSSLMRFVRHISLEDSTAAEDMITALTAAFATAKTEPWLAHAVLTQLGITAAWSWRGSGWSSTVTPEGWKGFERHLTAAEAHLTEAYRLQPMELHLGVMGITLAGAGHSKISMDEWFRRSVSACFDNREIWDQLRQFGTPRWGGTYDHLLALGCDAVATKRYDTCVPWQLFGTIAGVASDARSMNKEGDIKAPLTKPRVRQAVKDCIAGYIAARPSTADEYHSLNACYLWHCGDKAGARAALLDIKPEKRHAGVAEFMGLSYDQMLADTEPAEKNTF